MVCVCVGVCVSGRVWRVAQRSTEQQLVSLVGGSVCGGASRSLATVGSTSSHRPHHARPPTQHLPPDDTPLLLRTPPRELLLERQGSCRGREKCRILDGGPPLSSCVQGASCSGLSKQILPCKTFKLIENLAQRSMNCCR